MCVCVCVFGVQKLYSEQTAQDSSSYKSYLLSRLELLDGKLEDWVRNLVERDPSVEQQQSFVLVNPSPKTHLQKDDIL